MAATALDKQQAVAPRPPSPLYRELSRKSRLFPGASGILEVDYQSGLFGIEFPVGTEENPMETELIRTNHRFPLAGTEKVQPQSEEDTGRKVFYFDSSNGCARGSGDLTFEQTVRGKGRVNRIRMRLEVE